jgi:hypothetical protein
MAAHTAPMNLLISLLWCVDSLPKTLHPSHTLQVQSNRIEAIPMCDAGVGALDDGNAGGDHGFILEQPRSTRPDVEVHQHRTPLRSR